MKHPARLDSGLLSILHKIHKTSREPWNTTLRRSNQTCGSAYVTVSKTSVVSVLCGQPSRIAVTLRKTRKRGRFAGRATKSCSACRVRKFPVCSCPRCQSLEPGQRAHSGLHKEHCQGLIQQQSALTTKAGCVLLLPSSPGWRVLQAVVGSSRTCRGSFCSSCVGARRPDGDGLPLFVRGSSHPRSRLLSIGKLHESVEL